MGLKSRVISLFLLFYTLSILYCPLGAIGAEDADISVKSAVDNAFITIGDQVHFKITVTHDPKIQITQINTAEPLKDFEVKQDTPFKQEKSDGQIEEGRDVVFTSYQVGEYVMAPAIISYLDQNRTPQSTETNQLYLTVESIDQGQSASQDIKDVKGILLFQHSRWIWLALITGLLVIAAIWRLFNRQKKHMTAMGEQPALSADEEAYRALNRLIESNLLKQQLYREYFFQLSEIIRRYFERRFYFSALESTTDEVMQSIRQKNLDGKTLTLIRQTLEFCDLAKFAKYKPSPAEVLELNRFSKEIIDITKIDTANGGHIPPSVQSP
ncbi:MAG: hypothetical protein COV74_01700 [Candidatus Omnitrophica bacterium CG11_big_fil_rev_8_21_14_0_20_45_26]|uniref:Protein BatD n=1 Tax=Candidatus Abzuiibacterium crystallinum TaxID=1974748 RepID=A0A2H0LSC8_9BACT|nr:MAG: hypothetical protein COV74_01700 [Candidatus Omnitrophica bacterium CG11_big_fil_rev_8_21_14_0_20_45_26]PIW65010.1 MAG: hypothetical protein COW12_03980 [Candidatus Omnitrophica bacterium CG12_big_fil_rev_8_21_14_0_65_45_16]